MDAMRKRQRANTNGDQAPAMPAQVAYAQPILPQYDIAACIDVLDAADQGALTRQILIDLAITNPGVANLIRGYYVNLIQLE